MTAFFAPPALAQPLGDAAAGQRQFLACRACHEVKPGPSAKVGPHLAGVLGRAAGSVDGFAYSPALAKSGLTWDAATLDAFIAQPAKLVPGSRMAYAGLSDPKRRADLIAYLATLKP
jgi:cytochrome c